MKTLIIDAAWLPEKIHRTMVSYNTGRKDWLKREYFYKKAVKMVNNAAAVS